MIVFDLDGTLALIDHRRPLLDEKPPRWNEFYQRCDRDLPNWPVMTIARSLHAAGWQIEVWSGRSQIVREKTLAWLIRYGVPFHVLRMRPEGDFTPDQELKARWLDASKVRPLAVFDDRDKVVAMWRERGILCCQVAPGAF